MGKLAKASGSPATRVAGIPSSWSPACALTPATTTRRHPARSGRTGCARWTATSSVTPKVSELVVLAVPDHRSFHNGGGGPPLAHEEEREDGADRTDRHQDVAHDV